MGDNFDIQNQCEEQEGFIMHQVEKIRQFLRKELMNELKNYIDTLFEDIIESIWCLCKRIQTQGLKGYAFFYNNSIERPVTIPSGQAISFYNLPLIKNNMVSLTNYCDIRFNYDGLYEILYQVTTEESGGIFGLKCNSDYLSGSLYSTSDNQVSGQVIASIKRDTVCSLCNANTVKVDLAETSTLNIQQFVNASLSIKYLGPI